MKISLKKCAYAYGSYFITVTRCKYVISDDNRKFYIYGTVYEINVT